ncbi:urease accessory UreF family protein [soil metagenome]
MPPARAGARRIITTITTMPDDGGALYDLLSWMSPSWPIGAFAHSSGLEWAVEAGRVTDRASTAAWIGDVLRHGALWSDAVIFVHAHRATLAGDTARLSDVAELAVALLTSRERHLEATAQGAAYRRIATDAAPAEALAMLDSIDDDDLAYPVVAACHLAGHGIGLRSALTAFLHGAIANLVSAAQRLVPIGQTDGQRVLRDLRAAIADTVTRALTLDYRNPFAAMGSAALYADFAAIAHETQYTRLFRT